MKFLGRTLAWTEKGITMEGDRKHAEILVKEWGLENSKPVSSPGIPEEKFNQEDVDQNTEMNKSESMAYRRGAARINYMAMDRCDLSFVAKDLARSMAKPMIGDNVRMKRAIRYIKGRPRAQLLFVWQTEMSKLVTMVDSDWAGCTRTRRSTSGGVIIRGRHLLTHWSSTQANIALSSGEAELNAIVKGTSETLGMNNMMKSCGQENDLELRTDSSAASGVAHRRGCGKMKHLEAKQLWVQDVVMNKEIRVNKIPREQNPSDVCTHHWSTPDARHFERLGLHWVPLHLCGSS